MSAPATQGARRSTCSISVTPISTGWVSRARWASPEDGFRRWRRSTIALPRASPPPARSSSRWCSRWLGRIPALGARLSSAERDHHIEQGAGAVDAPQREGEDAEHKGDDPGRPQQPIRRVGGRRFGGGIYPLGARDPNERNTAAVA